MKTNRCKKCNRLFRTKNDRKECLVCRMKEDNLFKEDLLSKMKIDFETFKSLQHTKHCKLQEETTKRLKSQGFSTYISPKIKEDE